VPATERSRGSAAIGPRRTRALQPRCRNCRRMGIRTIGDAGWGG
jgi:hypothetical protein